jgi:hypothetical protein
MRLTTPLALAITIALGAAPAATQTYSGSIDPGELLVIKVAPDGEITIEEESANDLTQLAGEAIDVVPAWLAPDLADALRLQDPETQDELSSLIVEVADPLLVDEIAYAVAHVAPEDLAVADLDLIVENAEMIYDVADDLAYADLVELGEGDERYTTVTYAVVGPEGESAWTLPRDDYYAWIVHPQRDDGALRRTDPSNGAFGDPPDAWFFRDYFWNGAEGFRSYGAQISLRYPSVIDDAWLAGADFGGHPTGYGALEQFEVDPIVLARETGTDDPVAATFVWGNGSCHSTRWPNADGWVYATTIPLEAAADAGSEDLLVNLLYAGGGNAQLTYDVLNQNVNYAGIPASVLIVRDRLPFDLASDPNEIALQAGGYTVEVVDSATFAAMPIVVEETIDPDPEVDGDEYVRTYPDGISKIVVASDQPYALYQALVDKTEEIELFVTAGGILQLHLATRAEDDWSGLRMPTGIHCAGQQSADHTDDIEIYGYPRFADVIADAPLLWDGTKITPAEGGGGTLPLDDEMTAVERLGWFASQLLTCRITEQQVWERNANVERAIKPERIAWNHFGNCGELQDLITAAGRTALIPVMPVASLADDHVWNEFVFFDRWYPLQTSWSDSGWHVDDYNIAQDLDTGGGGKTVSGMAGFHADGWLESLLGRYETEVIDDEGHIHGDYSEHVTLVVRVEDANGEPVDGAMVLLATEGYYDPEELWVCAWSFTDREGTAEITAGEENEYLYQITSTLGVLPGASQVSPWLTSEETAEPDQTFETTVAYESAALPIPSASEVDPPAAGIDAPVLAVDVLAEREVLRGQSLSNDRTFTRAVSPGLVDVYVVDGANYAALADGQPFEAIAAATQVEDTVVSRSVPEGSEWYVVLSNQRRQASSQLVEVDVSLDLGGDAGPGGSGDDDGCGCGAVGSPSVSGFSLLRLLLDLIG